MASSRTKAPRHPRSTRNAAKPPSRTASRKTARRSRSKGKKASAPVATLPAWSDLSAKKSGAARQKRETKPSLIEGMPTLRFAVVLVAVCALFTLYVGHIYATQELVADVQQLHNERLRLVLKHNRLRGEFDRMTSPSVILDRAAGLGLEPSSAYGPTILTETP